MPSKSALLAEVTNMEKVADLKVRGYTPLQISEMLSMPIDLVYKYISSAYEKAQALFVEHGEALLAGDLMRLEFLATDYMQKLEVGTDTDGTPLRMRGRNAMVDRIIKLIELKAKIIQTQATLVKKDETKGDQFIFHINSPEYQLANKLAASGEYNSVFDDEKEVQSIMQKMEHLKEITGSPAVDEALEKIFSEGIRVERDTVPDSSDDE